VKPPPPPPSPTPPRIGVSAAYRGQALGNGADSGHFVGQKDWGTTEGASGRQRAGHMVSLRRSFLILVMEAGNVEARTTPLTGTRDVRDFYASEFGP